MNVSHFVDQFVILSKHSFFLRLLGMLLSYSGDFFRSSIVAHLSICICKIIWAIAAQNFGRSLPLFSFYEPYIYWIENVPQTNTTCNRRHHFYVIHVTLNDSNFIRHYTNTSRSTKLIISRLESLKNARKRYIITILIKCVLI